jgi:hypothetical protein
MKKYGKRRKKYFGPLTFIAKVITDRVIRYIGVKQAPYIVNDPDINYLSYKGQLTKTSFLLFPLLLQELHLRVTFVKNVKKFKIDPP